MGYRGHFFKWPILFIIAEMIPNNQDALFQTTVVFLANYEATESVVVNQGGTSSGKTYSILQVLSLRSIYEKGIKTLVTAQDVPALKKGAYLDIETIYNGSPFFQAHMRFWNKTDRTLYFKNGSLIMFGSNEDIEDAKHGKRDYLFINEANGIEFSVYEQLELRTTKQTFLDYNPSAPFWVHDRLIGHKDVKAIYSDHRHNTFLPQKQHDKIESIKDPETWKVYARGITGNLEGIIYTGWQQVEDDFFHKLCEENDTFFAGLDYGYTNDPTAAVKMIRIGDCIYCHELIYEPGMPARRIAQVFESNGFDGSRPIYAEHDPDMNSELNRLDVLVYAARKPKGSVLAGIMKVKEFKMFYTKSSKNIQEERKRYMWLTDPSTGKPINEPIDKWNHCMDAIRYGVYTHYYMDV